MHRLIADIDGTNARFALAGPDRQPIQERTLATAAYPGPVEAARAYLDGVGNDVADAVFAVGCPLLGDSVQFTNGPWRFSIRQTKQTLHLGRLVVVNDFVAQAAAIPHLSDGEIVKLGGGDPGLGRAIGVIGPSAGLGVAGLIHVRGAWRPLSSEGGHMSFAPGDEIEAEMLRLLRKRFGHVSYERLLHDPGLGNLASALAEIDGQHLDPLTPEVVVDRARNGTCPYCAEAIRRFSGILGSAAGDVALLYDARGGVYIGGDLCLQLGNLFDVDVFRARFVAKGRLETYLKSIPTYLITRSDIGLLGAASLKLDE